jgi:hypothetical protein
VFVKAKRMKQMITGASSITPYLLVNTCTTSSPRQTSSFSLTRPGDAGTYRTHHFRGNEA